MEVLVVYSQGLNEIKVFRFLVSSFKKTIYITSAIKHKTSRSTQLPLIKGQMKLFIQVTMLFSTNSRINKSM